MEYLYDDGEYLLLHEHRELRADAPDQGPARATPCKYLIPQLKVQVEFYEGKPMSVELPATVDMTVVETEPGLKGATVSNVTKPAKMETGLVVQVPPFITEGEKIRVNTAEGTYQAQGLKAPPRAPLLPPGKTVRRSTSSRPSSIRAMTGGSPRAAAAPAAAASGTSTAISQVGMDCSGVEPPPITDSPGTSSRREPPVRARPALRRARGFPPRVCRIMRSAGISSQRSSSRLPQGLFERLVDQLVEPQGAEHGVAAQARDQVRAAGQDARPAARPAACRR